MVQMNKTLPVCLFFNVFSMFGVLIQALIPVAVLFEDDGASIAHVDTSLARGYPIDQHTHQATRQKDH